MSSPFYAGRTMYGGAANYKSQNRISVGSNKDQIKVRPTCQTPSDTCGMSATTKRILDMLDRLSTPVLDARKIPVDHIPHVPSTSGVHRGAGPPTQSLTIPTVPELLKRRKVEADAVKPPARAETKELVPSKGQALLKSNSKETISGKAGGKVLSSVKERLKKQVPRVVEEASPEIIDLPLVPLPITSLPKFDQSPLPPPTQHKPPDSKNSGVTFKFSSPVTLTNSKSDILPAKPFTFSIPLSSQRDSSSSATKNFAVKKTHEVTSSREQDSKRSSVNNFMFEHKVPSEFVPKKRTTTDNVSPVGRKSVGGSELRTGSVMDVLGKKSGRASSGEKVSTSDEGVSKTASEGFGDRFKPPMGSWICGVCCVPNKSTLTKCAACETQKPNIVSEPKSSVLSSQTNDSKLLNQSKPTDKVWACGSCPEKNNAADVLVCGACKKSKPGSDAWSGFGDKFKPASDSWQCQSCFVRNNAAEVKCISCQTLKQGTGFGDKFKPKPNTWECGECFVRNQSSDNKCVACGNSKPGSGSEEKPKMPSPSPFQFSVTSKGFQVGAVLDKKGEKSESQELNSEKGFALSVFPAAPKQVTGGFQFGGLQNKGSPKNTPTGFTFGTPTESTMSKESSKANSSKANVTMGFTFEGQPKSESGAEKEKVGESKNESVGGFKFSVTAPSDASHMTENKITKRTLEDEDVNKTKRSAFTFADKPAESTVNPFVNSTPSIFGGKTNEVIISQGGFSPFQTKSTMSITQLNKKPTVTPTPDHVVDAAVKSEPTAPVRDASSLFQFGSVKSESSLSQAQPKSFSFHVPGSVDKPKTNPTALTTAAATTNMFTFAPAKAAPSSLSFGVPSPGGFNFSQGAPKTEAPPPFGSGSAPVFGAPQPPAGNQQSQLFVFGGGAPAATTAVSTNFSFGTPKEAEPSARGAFPFAGSTTQGQAAPQNNFSFGSPSVPPNLTGGCRSAPFANFNFDSAPSTAAPVFSFGETQNPGAAPFTFAAQAPQAPANTGNSGGFNFNPVTSLNFNAGPAAPFSGTTPQFAATPATQQRKFKKATRRNQPR